MKGKKMPRYIDAEKLVEYKASGVSELMPWQQGWNDAIDTIMDEVPTVEAEPIRHGHWETVFMSEATGYDPTLANYIDTVFCHRCSVCKEDARLDEFGEEMISQYCPNCGARMDETCN